MPERPAALTAVPPAETSAPAAQTASVRARLAAWLARLAADPWPGLLLGVGSFLVILAWVFVNNPLNAPDEPAHLQAIMVIRNQQKLPEIHYRFPTPTGKIVGNPGDASTVAYIRQIRPRSDFQIIPYESMQAPLYYMIVGAVSLARPPNPATVLYLARLVAALFGAATVYFCWATVRLLAPRAPWWALAVGGAIALLPQFGFNSATAANDSIFNCLAAATIYFWLRGLRDPTYDPWLLQGGAVFGLAVLAKLSALSLGGGLALVVLFRAFQGRPDVGTASLVRYRLGRGLRMALGSLAGALAVCGWWIVRNQIIYHEPTGSRDAFLFYHGRFVQLNLSDPTSLTTFLQNTWESFWGRFGWMSLRLPDVLYVLTGVLTVATLVLSVIAGVRFLRRAREGTTRVSTFHWQTAAVLLVVAVGVIAGYLQYNLGVNLQAQGRYLFALLLPYGILLTGGLYALAPAGRIRAVACAIPLAWLAFLNVTGLYMTLTR